MVQFCIQLVDICDIFYSVVYFFQKIQLGLAVIIKSKLFIAKKNHSEPNLMKFIKIFLCCHNGNGHL